MSRELLNEIPPGAFLTVTLKNGTKFKGYEDGQNGPFQEGVLRMTTGFVDGEKYDVFFASCEELACFQMTCES